MTSLNAPAFTLRRLLSALAVGALVIAGLWTPGQAGADTTPPAGTPATVSADGLPT